MASFVNRGRKVIRNPYEPGDGPVVVDPALIVPDKIGEQVNGAPVDDTSKEFVIRKNNAQD